MPADYEDRIRALERKVIAAAAGGWLRSIEAIRELIASESPDAQRAILALAAPKLGDALTRGVAQALGLGLSGALRDLKPYTPRAELVRVEKDSRKTARAPAPILTTLAALSAAADEAISTAVVVLGAGGTPADSFAYIAGYTRRLTTTIEDSLNDAANYAIREVSETAGLPMVWVAERNACVRCLRYSGEIAYPGEPFEPGLTYLAAGTGPTGTIRGPKLHPHCRCHLEPMRDISYSNALRREADRSILRGIALEGESRVVRTDAARRLLDSGVDAPKSVIAFARRSLAEGKFPGGKGWESHDAPAA